MPATDAPRTLKYTVQQVLETMCFSEALPASDLPPEECVIGATVSFGGTLSGRLRVEISSFAASRLASSFLGQDVAVGSPLAEHTVCELGNVICGRFLSLLNPSAHLNIHPPITSETPIGDAGLIWQNFRAD